MNDIEKLTEFFTKFPGIGPRQARRFVFFMLTRSNAWKHEFIKTIQSLEQSTAQCHLCKRFADSLSSNLCTICADTKRDITTLVVVEKDVDVEAIEKSGLYNGVYFVLGGTFSFSQNKKRFVRDEDLYAHIKKYSTHTDADRTLSEVILALSATTEGEYTTEVLKDKIREIAPSVRVTLLGRGLSTGSEIEYADSNTIKHALNNRFKL